MAVSNKEWKARQEMAEQSCESFRATLRACFSSRDVTADEVVAAFNELVEMARRMGQEEERRREKLFVAVLTYGPSRKTMKFGPTASRDSVMSAANGWQQSHGNFLLKEGPSYGIEVRPYEEGEDDSP